MCYNFIKGSELYVKKAIRKYGENSFRIEEIDNASTLEELK